MTFWTWFIIPENMTYNPEIHHRRSIRLKEYDYSQAGAYFVTVCAWGKECLFGEIRDGEIHLNEFGTMTTKFWNDMSTRFPYIELDAFVIMPNHVHGIIVFNDICRGEVTSPFSEVTSPFSEVVTPDLKKKPATKQGGDTPPLQRNTLGRVVAHFKYQSAKEINRMRNTPGYPLWQRNYYEHIIRDENELNRIREYIINNQLQWADDENNPENIKTNT